MTYAFGVERWADVYPEFEPLLRRHYEEMAARLAAEGHDASSPFAPRVDAYGEANDSGRMVFFTIRADGSPVGYAIIYVSQSMHNGDLVAHEDAIYVLPEHRNGIGRKLIRRIIAALREAGVKRVSMAATTDPRAEKLWRRLGFKPVAMQMTCHL